MKTKRHPWLDALVWALLLALVPGCARMFTAKTTLHYEERRPDGTTVLADWASDKDHVGLEAQLGDKPKITVDKAGTPESVIAAVLQVQLNLLQRLDALVAKLAAAPLAAGS